MVKSNENLTIMKHVPTTLKAAVVQIVCSEHDIRITAYCLQDKISIFSYGKLETLFSLYF